MSQMPDILNGFRNGFKDAKKKQILTDLFTTSL